ncbi:MAG: hypothetical protein CMJ49_03725 [Planctomycetaceae bacterium]|nr:hypothetical protein [Planctomycetaceae bacterium]
MVTTHHLPITSLTWTLGLLLGIGATAVADPINLPVVYSKPPDMGLTGQAYQSEDPLCAGGQEVAGDWLLTSVKPIAAARWWGTYLDPNYEPDPNGPPDTKPFSVAFYNDDVHVPMDPPFYPDALDWGHYWVSAEETFFGTDAAGNNVWEYSASFTFAYEPVYDFSYYWMSVQLINDDLSWPLNVWGWHNSEVMARDADVADACSGWYKLTDDVAFELMRPLFPDANGDGCVDVGDLAMVGSQWATAGPEADFNGDGQVDIGDLALLGAHWGDGCSTPSFDATSADTNAAAVPTPTAFAAGLTLLVATSLRRHRRRAA